MARCGPKLKAKCKRGHKFTPENTKLTKLASGYTVRQCKRCRAQRDSLRYATDPAYQALARARANVRNRLERNVGIEGLGEG